MTLHRRTLYWFRRFGIAPAIPHYMVKNVLIGKNSRSAGNGCADRGALRWIKVYFE